ncbi:unknown [Prevotella sp. CAG:485]|nr:unknown [Prevotella sp. CAG:485]
MFVADIVAIGNMTLVEADYESTRGLTFWFRRPKSATSRKENVNNETRDTEPFTPGSTTLQVTKTNPKS